MNKIFITTLLLMCSTHANAAMSAEGDSTSVGNQSMRVVTFKAVPGTVRTYYYHHDHLGSTTLITNKSGEVVQRVEYLPTGETFIEQQDTSWVSPYKFNGKELDEETGLYYYGARYYDPRLSLWLGTDPMQEDCKGKTTYNYCDNNPVTYFDPNGMKKHNWMKPSQIMNGNYQFNRVVGLAANNSHYSNRLVQIWAHGLSRNPKEPSNGMELSIISAQRSKYGNHNYYRRHVYEKVYDAKTFAKYLDVYDRGWKKSNNGKPIVILHSCTTSDFAKKLSSSAEFKDVYVIAPNAVLNSSILGESVAGGGLWLVYRNGEQVKGKSGEPITYDSNAQVGTIGFDYGF
jgi:RHS repeat-associated protein